MAHDSRLHRGVKLSPGNVVILTNPGSLDTFDVSTRLGEDPCEIGREGPRRTSMSHAVAITDASFDTEVLNGPHPVVVDFWAEWCAPCRMVAPVLEELAAEYGGKVKVAKLNIDDNPSTSAKFGIRSVPTLLFFKGGRLVDQYVGAASKSELKKRLDGLL